jgi:DNA helicase HerA-like ATPase
MNPDRDGKIFVGKGADDAWLALALANRHGLVTGATGTGKTVSLQVLAEGFSRAGVPVFAADIKGDLSGIAARGEAKPNFKRAKDLGFDYQPEDFPVVFWDLLGEQGHPIRANVFEMGPLLVARMLELNDVQEGIINIGFRFADDDPELGEADANGLVDLKDLRELLAYLSKNAKDISARYGNVAVTAVGAVQRQLLVLENQGGTKFFGEPALDINDLMRVDAETQRGVINVLAADKLMANPRLYATFLLWLLSELFEKLPEVGDPLKPKLVFFFDEAHLLFNEAPKVLLDKVEQVVRLIRSKGVGVYFVTQNPLDVPEKVLAQLGGRVQHALRAFTPRDQKAVAAAADTFRPNPKLNTAQVITQLGKGEALVSFLEGDGTMVDRILVRPPSARIGPVSPEERAAVINRSPLKGKYDQTIDPESAYEILQRRLQTGAVPAGTGPAGAGQGAQPESGGILATIGSALGGFLGGLYGTNRQRGIQLTTTQSIARQVTRTVTNKVAGQIAADLGKSVGGAAGQSVGRAIVRGALGGILRR